MVGAAGVEQTAAFCQSRIDAFYRTVADQIGKPESVYLAEKSSPGPPSPVTGLLDEIYPGRREIVLVRDFRDIFCSWRSFSMSRSIPQPPGVETDEDRLRFWSRQAALMLSHWRKRSSQVHLVRFEDLFLRPAPIIEGLLRYLALDARPETVETLVSALNTQGPAQRSHMTSPSRHASIGRWQRDLDPALQEAATESFGPALEEFGYEL